MDSTREKEFNTIYEKYNRLLFNIIFSYAKERTLAEDILQEVFLAFLTKGPTGKTDDFIKYWLIRVAINKSLNEIKKKNRELVNDENILAVTVDNEDDGNKRIVLNEVYNLPEKLKVVTILYYFNEMKISEISEALKIKESAIKMRLKNARDILKERLKQNGIY